MQLDFFFDYRSPYAYLANSQFAKLGIEAVYRPIDVLALMRAVNNQPSTLCPPKTHYAAVDAGRWARHYGVAYEPNWGLMKEMSAGRLDATLLLRAGLAAKKHQLGDAIHATLFEAVWAGNAKLADAQGRHDFLAHHGIGLDLWSLASDPELEEVLQANNAEAVARGAFGVPTMFVGDEMFFGNDRLHFVAQRLGGAQREEVAA